MNKLTSSVVKRYNAWAYLFWGPEIIQKAFDEAKGKPFELLAPDNRYVFVSDPQQIKEIDSAPDTVLSLQAASKQVRSCVWRLLILLIPLRCCSLYTQCKLTTQGANRPQSTTRPEISCLGPNNSNVLKARIQLV